MTQLRTVAISTRTGRVSPQLFQSLVLTAPGREAGHKNATLVISIGIHSTLALALAMLPLLLSNALPNPGVLETFFATPLEITVAPPPPPPPPGGGQQRVRPVRTIETPAGGFVAPVEIPTEIRPEDGFSPEIGDPNGVPGGVPDGVVGAIVHVPDDVTPPPPPPKVVRIGGQIAQPQPVARVEPRYPQLAIDTRVSGVVIVEAEVDTAGHVKTVKLLRGHPLLDQAALEAVKQWRYRPLLLNGEPTGFILTVTVDFRIQRR